MSKKMVLPQGVTPDELKKLTAQHGPLFPVTVRSGDKALTGLFKKPKLEVIALAATKNDPVSQGKLIFNTCKVVIDPEMETIDEAFAKALGLVANLFQVWEGEVGEPYA